MRYHQIQRLHNNLMEASHFQAEKKKVSSKEKINAHTSVSHNKTSSFSIESVGNPEFTNL